MEILKKLNMRRINLAVAFPIKTISTDSTKNFNQKKKNHSAMDSIIINIDFTKTKKKKSTLIQKSNTNSKIKPKFEFRKSNLWFDDSRWYEHAQ